MGHNGLNARRGAIGPMRVQGEESVMAELKFYRCNTCGNLFMVINDSGAVPVCCGQPMKELKAGSTDAAVEKHVPAVTVEDGKIDVVVGEVEHPMAEEHYIEWIAFNDSHKTVVKHLKPGDKPQAHFCTCGGEGGTVYAYCNLHGLWKAEV